ncbi:hypothetical protein [Methylobacterium soli]|uniref:Phage tail protein n=1 Tax=Methylobacterium soli TaxID=553447 RepID=A0A6L3SZ66_9HYPH|nr:hypothetical protein [Methylobacterium soli]KAB1079423.1 hypothetical protein F6X53_11510 [Methylobacterium soli]GJE45362.1 hypothetical protein AEGHOMDF_4556 [Methylobacterium soli]
MTPEAIEVRDLAFERLLAFGTFKTVRNGISEQIEPADQLPAATVFLRRENRTPDGDANVGEPSFVHDVTLGILVTIDAGSKSDLEPVLHSYTNDAIGFLLSDTTFLSEIEAVTGIDETHVFPKDGETYYAEARVEFSVTFRTSFEPFVPTAYRGANFKTTPSGASGDTPAIRTRIPAPTA